MFHVFILTLLVVNFESCSKAQPQKPILKIKDELVHGELNTLYHDTYLDILNRIEPDGYFKESASGRYTGMYPRTIGALVSLLIETEETELAERLIRCVLNATISNNSNRIPHVIEKQTDDKGITSYRIIGNTDQIDGQAHIILAWARLALHRGQTEFEDTTWHFVADLLTRSTQRPYFSNEDNRPPRLIHNFAFEHSRLTPTNYDLLSQCFVGAALESMITVAHNREEHELAQLWKKRISVLKDGINQYFITRKNNQTSFNEMLINEDDKLIPLKGVSWVNLSPVAAQWNPSSDSVMINTVKNYRASMKNWNDIKWVPTHSWDDGTCSAQIIGKAIGWEIDFCRQHQEWERIDEIFKMVNFIHIGQPIFMENSYLFDGTDLDIYQMNNDELKKLERGIWKLEDPGNGEQVAWWCWSIARLRKNLGLPPSSDKIKSDTKIKVIKPNKTQNGITYEFYYKNREEKSYEWLNNKSNVSGVQDYFDLNAIRQTTDNFGVKWKGFIDIEEDGNYRFFFYSKNSGKLYINDQLVSDRTNFEKEIYLNKELHAFTLEYDHQSFEEQFELYYQKGNLPIRKKIDSERIFPFDHNKSMIPSPKIHPLSTGIETGETIEVTLSHNNEYAKIYYTLDESEPTRLSIPYTMPFALDSPKVVKARAYLSDSVKSTISHIQFNEIPRKYSFNIKHPPNEKYAQHDYSVLNDGLLGSSKFNDGRWLGFEGDDFHVDIDLLQKKSLTQIKVGFLLDQASWIFPPEKLLILTSNDNKIFKEIDSDLAPDLTTNLNYLDLEAQRVDFQFQLENQNIRYLKIIAKNIKTIPQWHTGAGSRAWIFIDEIKID